MPVTAKLSRKFYELLGDDVAGELVDWFNAVDITYQGQLKETNDLNWERFKATLQAETAVMRADLLKTRETNDLNWDRFKATMQAETAVMRADLLKMRETNDLNWDRFKATMQAEMAVMRADLLKWMFIYWSGSAIAVGGLIAGMRMLGPR